MKLLTVIPARGGSKGIPRKNIRELRGRPLVCHAIRAAREARRAGRVVVSTDDREIADIAAACGAEIPFLRPPELATDDVTLIHVIRHALRHFDGLGERFDAVLSLQPTCPLIRPGTVDEAVRKLVETGCDAVTTVAPIRHGHPLLSKRVTGPGGDEVEDFLAVPADAVRYPRQRREEAFYLTGSLFLRRRGLLDDFDPATNCLGPRPRVLVLDAEEALNIDDELDFQLAGLVLDRRAAEGKLT